MTLWQVDKAPVNQSGETIMQSDQTYAVYACNDRSIDAETDLTAHDVVRHIYRHDGADYRLEPKMLMHRYDDDDDDNELPDIQDITDSGALVFEIWFKSPRGHWSPSRRTAIGKNENEAEEAFLQESFDGTMWDDSHWIVLTTEQPSNENTMRFSKKQEREFFNPKWALRIMKSAIIIIILLAGYCAVAVWEIITTRGTL